MHRKEKIRGQKEICPPFSHWPDLSKNFPWKPFRQEVKDKDIEGALQLSNLSVTRWVSRSESIVAVMWASLDGIIAALDKEAESEDAKTRVYKAKNQLEAVKCFEFIMALMFMRNVMSKTKILTNPVQAIELNIADAHTLEENTNLQIEAAVAFSA